MGNTDPWTSLVAQQPASAAALPPQPATPQQDPWLALSPAKEAPTDPWTSLVTPPATTQPKPEAPTFVGKAWDWLNEPSGNATTERRGADRDRRREVRWRASCHHRALPSPLDPSGADLWRKDLCARAMTAVDATGAIQKGRLVANMGFLTKYGFDLGKEHDSATRNKLGRLSRRDDRSREKEGARSA